METYIKAKHFFKIKGLSARALIERIDYLRSIYDKLDDNQKDMVIREIQSIRIALNHWLSGFIIVSD